MASVRAARSNMWKFTNRLRILVMSIAFATGSVCSIGSQPTSAQAVTWTEADINAPATAGTFAYAAGTPPTYTVAGSSAGVTAGYDQGAFAYTTAAGNIEIYGQLTSQSSANSGASAGLIVRDSFVGSANKAALTVSKSGALTFFYQTVPTGGGSTTGPTVSLPVYLKISRSGNTLAGYYASPDTQNWTLVGSVTEPTIMPTKYYAGFFSGSTDSTLNSAVFKNVVYSTSVPQQGSNLLLWLRADQGVTASGGAVSSWADQSGNALNATQTVAANKPTLTTGVVNNGVLPVINFNGTANFLSCPSGFSSFNNGYSAFIVLKPTNITSTGDPCAMGNASNSDAIFPQIVNNNAKLFVYNGTTASSVVTTSTPISASNYQLLEETVVPGSSTSTGTIFVNGAQQIQSTTLNNPNNVSRTNNVIGAGIGPANYFNGGIAEILIFNTLTGSQRASVESYVLSKYAVGTQPTLDPPTFVPSSGIFTPAQSVSLTQSQNATPYFTVDGTTPSTSISSQWFNTTPIPINSATILKALAAEPFFNNSSVVSASYLIDPSTSPVSRNGLILWLRADQQVATSGSNVVSWGDSSASLNTASQTVSTAQPLFVANAVNGLPAVNFTGSKYLQLPVGMADFTGGASLFVVLKPTSVTAGARIIDLGNGATSDNLQLQLPSSTSAALYAYSGSSPTSVTASGAISVGNFGLLEAIHNGSASASIYNNGVLDATGAVNNLANIQRTLNFVGQASAGGNSLNGQIAELMLYKRGVTSAERAAIEGYFLQRYWLSAVNSPAAPKFNIGTSTLTAPAQIELEAPANAQIFYTTDGTTPTTSSAQYIAPINVYFTQTVKSIAVLNGVSSSVASATYTLDSTQYPAPGASSTPLQLDLQLPNPSIPQDSNQR